MNSLKTKLKYCISFIYMMIYGRIKYIVIIIILCQSVISIDHPAWKVKILNSVAIFLILLAFMTLYYEIIFSFQSLIYPQSM